MFEGYINSARGEHDAQTFLSVPIGSGAALFERGQRSISNHGQDRRQDHPEVSDLNLRATVSGESPKDATRRGGAEGYSDAARRSADARGFYRQSRASYRQQDVRSEGASGR